jgi:hypothetical protein
MPKCSPESGGVAVANLAANVVDRAIGGLKESSGDIDTA